MWSYGLDSAEWKQLNAIPAEGRRGGLFFGNATTTLYYTTGIDESNIRLKETWKIHNPLNIPSNPEEDQISIYPNPVSEVLFLMLPPAFLNEDTSYMIFNTLGRIVQKENIAVSKTQIDVSQLSRGVYFVLLQSKGLYAPVKIVKF